MSRQFATNVTTIYDIFCPVPFPPSPFGFCRLKAQWCTPAPPSPQNSKKEAVNKSGHAYKFGSAKNRVFSKQGLCVRDTRHFRHIFVFFRGLRSKALVFVDRVSIRHFRRFRQKTLFSVGGKDPVWLRPRFSPPDKYSAHTFISATDPPSSKRRLVTRHFPCNRPPNPRTFKDAKKWLKSYFRAPGQSDSKLLKSESKVTFWTTFVTLESLLSSFWVTLAGSLKVTNWVTSCVFEFSGFAGL